VSLSAQPRSLTPRRRPSNRGTLKPRLEYLEERIVLSTVSWNGGGGNFDWNTALNWSGDVLPGPSDDVTINLGTNDFTIVYAAGNDAIHSLTSQAALNVAGGELTVASDSHLFGSLTVSATFGGAGNITVDGAFAWSGGTLQGVGGQGSLTANGGTSIAGGNSNSYLQGGFKYVNPLGVTATWTNGGIFLYDHSIFDNYGTVDLQGDMSMGSYDFVSEFNNFGMFIKSGGVANNPGRGSELAVGMTSNSGTITNEVGTLTLGDVGTQTTNTGSIIGQAGTNLYLLGTQSGAGSIEGDVVAFFYGTATISGSFEANRTYISEAVTMTGAVTGLGMLEVDGTLDLTNATLSPAALTLDSLSLYGTLITHDNLTVAGAFAWNGGTLQGVGGQGSLTVLSDMTLDGTYTVVDFSLINAGHAIWTGGTVVFYGTSSFTNTAAATFDDQTDGGFGSADGCCQIFDNQGLFLKSGGTGATDLNMDLYNSGTVQIDEGVLNIGCGYVQVTGTGGGSGGTISGNFTGAVTIQNVGQLTVNPVNPTPITNYTQTVTGSLVEQIGGLTAGTQYGQIIVNGNVSLNGSLSVDLINGFTPVLGNQFTVIDDRGTNPISGTFTGLPEGAVLWDGSYGFTVSYVGGTGNDLVLTVTSTLKNVEFLPAPNGSGTYGGTSTLTATLTAAGAGLAGEPVSFTLNNGVTVTTVGTATTGADGVATLTGVSLACIGAGTYIGYVGAGFAGDSSYHSGSGPAT